MSELYFSEIKEIKAVLSKIKHTQLFVLVDNETEKHCYSLLKPYLGTHVLISVPNGETNKTLATCTLIWEILTKHEADRNALLINLGGGVITDMGGFCAGTYKRGINFINIPTTLLSQVDASVGGKTGVDFEGYKNHIGLFYEPLCVMIDTVFHHTLPDNQLLSGFAEMLKHGLIADMDHWKALKEAGYSNINVELIKHSVTIKEKVVKADPTEKGLRKILNFGHTIGHAIESYCLTNQQELLHGEAVAWGMVAEAYLSNKKGMLGKSDQEEIEEYIRAAYKIPEIEKTSYPKILRLCKQDKKNQSGEVFMSLLEKPGKATFNISVDEVLILKALDHTLKLKF
ncbi:3-dehydroquinate synthase [Marivirga sp. S37H4]|uniref:3-dehydroquinate synthase n=1 Tax=Marivirga aurantiaca TaxID=2802615 RepID=A0A934WYN0_9BACT|nr:3-dehydroquinate synthase [Marivirga aurantiaca]MBK6265205.1 3-dehydroquinate synthase [Marivirga aurantiaca]